MSGSGTLRKGREVPRIKMTELGKLLGYLSTRFYFKWPAADLPATEREGQILYATYDAVDAWLAAPARCYFGFAAPITTEQLVSGAVVLVVPEDVKDELGGTEHTDHRNYNRYFRNLLERGYIAGVQMRRLAWLLERNSVEAFIARRAKAQREAFTTKQLEAILGLTTRGVQLVIDTRLELYDYVGPRGLLYVAKDCVFAYLAEYCTLFGSFMTWEEWAADRLASPVPLLSVQEVMAEMELKKKDVYRLIRIGVLSGIKTQRRVFITPRSVKMYYLRNWLSSLRK